MKVLRIAIALAGIIVADVSAYAQVILYDNQYSVSDWNDQNITITVYPSGATLPGNGALTDEVGDEINLIPATPRTVTDISLQYYTANMSASPAAQMEFRVYRNDGPLTGGGFNTPGTMLYDSGTIAVPQINGRNTLNLANLNFTVPDSFTWSVQFSSILGNTVAGLVVHETPTAPGSSFNDFWEKPGGTWDLYNFQNYNPAGNFAVQFSAVPEPAESATAFLGIALVVGIAVRRYRRTQALQH